METTDIIHTHICW